MNKGIVDFSYIIQYTIKKSFLTSKTFEEIKSLSIDEIFRCDDYNLQKEYIGYILILNNLIRPDFFEYFSKNGKPELFLVRRYLCMFT